MEKPESSYIEVEDTALAIIKFKSGAMVIFLSVIHKSLEYTGSSGSWDLVHLLCSDRWGQCSLQAGAVLLNHPVNDL